MPEHFFHLSDSRGRSDDDIEFQFVLGDRTLHSEDPRLRVRISESSGGRRDAVWPDGSAHQEAKNYHFERREQPFVHLTHDFGLHRPQFTTRVKGGYYRREPNPKIRLDSLQFPDQRPTVTHLGLDIGWSYLCCVAFLEGISGVGNQEHPYNAPFLGFELSPKEVTRREELFPADDFFVFCLDPDSNPPFRPVPVRLRMLHSPRLYERFFAGRPGPLKALQNLHRLVLPKTELFLRLGVLADFPAAKLVLVTDEDIEQTPGLHLRNLKGMLRLADRMSGWRTEDFDARLDLTHAAPSLCQDLKGTGRYYYFHQAIGEFFGVFWREIAARFCRVGHRAPQVGLCFTGALSRASRAVLRGAVARELRLDPSRDLLQLISEDSANAKGAALRTVIQRLLRETGPEANFFADASKAGGSPFFDVLVMDSGGMTLDVSLNTLQFHGRPHETALRGTTLGHVIQSSRVYPYLGGDYLTTAFRDLLPFQLLAHLFEQWEDCTSPPAEAAAEPGTRRFAKSAVMSNDDIAAMMASGADFDELPEPDPRTVAADDDTAESGRMQSPEVLFSLFELFRELCAIWLANPASESGADPQAIADTKRLIEVLFTHEPTRRGIPDLKARSRPDFEAIKDFGDRVLGGNPAIGAPGTLFRWIHGIPTEHLDPLTRVAYADCDWLTAQQQGELTFRPWRPPARENHPGRFLLNAVDQLFRVQLLLRNIDLLTPLAESVKLGFRLESLLEPDLTVRGAAAGDPLLRVQFAMRELAGLRRELDRSGESPAFDARHLFEVGLPPELVLKTSLPPLVAAARECVPEFQKSTQRALGSTEDPIIHVETVRRKIREWCDSPIAESRQRLAAVLRDFGARVPGTVEGLPDFTPSGSGQIVGELEARRAAPSNDSFKSFHNEIAGLVKSADGSGDDDLSSREFLRRFDVAWGRIEQVFEDRPVTREVTFGSRPFDSATYQLWTYIAGQSSRFPAFKLAFQSVLQTEFSGVGLSGHENFSKTLFPVLSFNAGSREENGLSRKFSAAEGAAYEAMIRTSQRGSLFFAGSCQAYQLVVNIYVVATYHESTGKPVERFRLFRDRSRPTGLNGDLVWVNDRSIDLTKEGLETVEVYVERAVVSAGHGGEDMARRGLLFRLNAFQQPVAVTMPHLNILIRRRHHEPLAALRFELHAEDPSTGEMTGGYLEEVKKRQAEDDAPSIVGCQSRPEERNRFFIYSDLWAQLDWDDGTRTEGEEIDEARRHSVLRIDQLPIGENFSSGLVFPTSIQLYD